MAHEIAVHACALGKEKLMERHFEKDMNVLKERLLWMGSLAERSVHQAVHAVLESDEPLAKRVLDEEDAINELQMEIDDRVVQLLALHQLMATDLRFVLAISRINNDLERIGDQAVNIAQGALRILRHPRVKPYVDLPRMSDLVEEMVREALNAVVRRDVDLAHKVLATDDQVDHYRDQIFRELLTYMMGDSSVVFPAFELILAAKNLEVSATTPPTSPRTLSTSCKGRMCATPPWIDASIGLASHDSLTTWPLVL